MEKPNNMIDIEKAKKIAALAISKLTKEDFEQFCDLDQPTQPEGYQGLNKWYVSEKGSVYFINSNIELLGGYGLGFDGNWIYLENLIHISKIKRLATEPEIIKTIKKGLEQKGIVEGARVKCLFDKRQETLSFNEIIYESDENLLWIETKDDLNCLVFDNGTFAEVVKEEKETDKWDKLNNELDVKLSSVSDEDLFKWYAKNRAKKETKADKELLKECEFYVLHHYNIYQNKKTLELLELINQAIKPN